MTEMSGDDGLREAIALAIYASDFGDSGDWDEEPDTFQGEYRANADATLALPELAALRAKAAAVDRVEATVARSEELRYPTVSTAVLRRRLDGTEREDRGRC